MCLEIYELTPANVFTSPGLAWHRSLNKTIVKLYLITDTDMLLMEDKGIRGGTSYAIHEYAKANNKFMKGFYKNKKSSYLKYWDVNNLYGYPKSYL